MIQYIGQDGRVRYLGDTELMHYNHNHDKLGRFASSGGSAGSAQRGLRKLERHRVNTLGREMKEDYKARKLGLKADNKLSKALREPSGSRRKDSLHRKADKAMEKANKHEYKMQEYYKNRKETEALIDKAIRNAEKNGYTVSSKHVSMSSQRGQDFVNEYIGSYLIGPAAGVAKRKRQHEKYGERWNNQTPTYISAKKYKVRE